MRIAIVGNFALTGNQTMAVRALPLARLLASRGHAVRIALPVRTAEDRPGAKMEDEVEVHQVGAGAAPGALGWVWQILQMLHLSWRWRPDVLYCFKPIAHSGVLLSLFLVLRRLRLYRGRIVLDTDDWEGHGGWNDKQPFPRWLKGLISRQEEWSIRHADAVTVASLELARLVTQLGASEVQYIPNCLESGPTADNDAAFALRESLGCSAAPLVLVYTRFVEYGLTRLLDTIDAVLRRAADARFLVTGTGLRGEEKELGRLLAERMLEERVRLLGWATQGETAALFAASDIALYLLDDNLLNRTKCPMKLAELVSAGVPVVADRVGQAAEYIQNGETGALVQAGNVEEMASRAASLLSDHGLRRRMGEAARLDAADRLRWDHWLPILSKALGIRA